MLMKKLFAVLVIVGFLVLSPGIQAGEYAEQKASITWYNFNHGYAKANEEGKIAIIDCYTDWCGWCKVMDKKTFSNPVIAKYISENYYAVKFDAEQKEPLTYNGKTFKYIPNGRRGIHEFALQILNGKASFPSVVFFTKNEEYLQVIPGFQSKEQMEKITHFFAEEAYLTKDWETFAKEFKSQL